MHRTIRAVILDLDGTLIDSNEAHALSWLQALKAEGMRYTLDEISPLIGMGNERLLPALTRIPHQSERGMRIARQKRQIFMREFFPALRPTPGAERLLRRLRNEGIKIGIASSFPQEDLRELLGILHCDFLTQGDACLTAPGIETTLELLHSYPAETLMLGDSPYDIEAALQAGVQTIAVRCGGRDDAELPGAIAVYDNPLDLLENLESSPLCSALLSKAA